MKNRIYYYSSLFALIGIVFLWSNCGTSQSIKNLQAKVDSLVRIPKIKFTANQAIPTSFRSINLSGGYDLYITKDTVKCYLPYYGRAYTAEYGGLDDAGIKFVSTNFDYQQKSGKNNSYDITIKPKDRRKPLTLYLNIQPSGYAYLQVNDPDRQSISFYGTIDY